MTTLLLHLDNLVIPNDNYVDKIVQTLKQNGIVVKTSQMSGKDEISELGLTTPV